MERTAAIRAKRQSWRRHSLADLAEVVCCAIPIGVFGAGAGAVWSLAFGFGARAGALCGGLAVFALGVVVVVLGARSGKAFWLAMAALAILALEMVQGAIVWGIRVAL